MTLVRCGLAVLELAFAPCAGVPPTGSWNCFSRDGANVGLRGQAAAAKVDRASSWARSCLVSPLAAAGATQWLPCFSSRLEGERRSDDRRELYCCEGWIEVDAAVDPRVEPRDPGDVAVSSAVFCLLCIFWLIRSDSALLGQQVMLANSFRFICSR